MPAHPPLSAIGNEVVSNGRLLTGVDWGANRLVDALARQAAASVQAPKTVRCLLKSGQVAVKHFAALLAVVTHAADNHSVEFQFPDGSTGTRTVRDAQQPSCRTDRRLRQPPPPAPPKPLLVASVSAFTVTSSRLGRALRSGRAQLPLHASGRGSSSAARRAARLLRAGLHLGAA